MAATTHIRIKKFTFDEFKIIKEVLIEWNYEWLEYDIIHESESYIWADKDLLLRVFNNLFKNAIQATSPETGKIKVTLKEVDDSYEVSVEDNGVGIKEEEREKIFVPYFTTKSTGTGLGLAMCKQIVEGMSGEIWFESELDVGTTFYVSFPKFSE